MRTKTLLAIAALVAIAMITLFGGLAGAAGTTVKLGDNFFDPDRKTIAKGTRVRFKWIGEEEHNVVKKRGPGPGFASETTDVPGVNFTKRFKRAGRYRLVCTIHPEDMTMVLRVRR